MYNFKAPNISLCYKRWRYEENYNLFYGWLTSLGFLILQRETKVLFWKKESPDLNSKKLNWNRLFSWWWSGISATVFPLRENVHVFISHSPWILLLVYETLLGQLSQQRSGKTLGSNIKKSSLQAWAQVIIDHSWLPRLFWNVPRPHWQMGMEGYRRHLFLL